MAAQPRKAKRSPAQVKASQAFARAGRAAQAKVRQAAIAKTGKPPPRSRKQQAASRNFAAAGRAAQAARRAGKQPVKPKAVAAPCPDMLGSAGSLNKPAPQLRPTGLPAPLNSQFQLEPGPFIPSEPAFSLHRLPACGPVALAEHLAVFTGILVPDEAILALHDRAGVISLDGLLERVAAEGLAGPETRLAHFERCDPDTAVPGLIYGIQLRVGYHAVLLRPDGMLSWGQVMPRHGVPAEAWWLEWEAE